MDAEKSVAEPKAPTQGGARSSRPETTSPASESSNEAPGNTEGRSAQENARQAEGATTHADEAAPERNPAPPSFMRRCADFLLSDV